MSIEVPKLQLDLAALRREMFQGATTAAVMLKNEFQAVSPEGGTKSLVNAWIAEPAQSSGNTISVSVKNPTVQAVVVDDGARPHFPPYGKEGERPALGQWIQRVLGLTAERDIKRMAYAIGIKMHAVGIKARHLFEKRFTQVTPKIHEILDAALQRGLDKVNK